MQLLPTLFCLILLLSSVTMAPYHKALNLAAIDEHVLAIQAKAGYGKKVVKALWGMSSQGGEMIAYLDSSNTPTLITTTLYGERGQSCDSFYCWDKQLWFYKRTTGNYDQSIYHDQGKVNVTHADRYRAYFRPNKLEYLFLNGSLVVDSVIAKDFQDDVLTSLGQYLDSCKIQ